MEDVFQVGAITQTHGVRGEVKVFPLTDDIGRFQKGTELLLDTGKEMLPVVIESVKSFKQFVILKFKGIDSINDVEKYKKKYLCVTRENAIELKEDEYFIADLIGVSVVTDEGEELGEIADVLQTGANDVYAVRRPDGSEVLLPAIRECVLKIDIGQKKMEIHKMPGLF